ncbi:MAG: glycosyltransferase [Pseudomonadota bacterium]
MSRNLSVSIIIVNYNQSQFLEQAILSAINQDPVEVEVIVVDDGSSDESEDILRKYQDSTRIIRQQNSGACAARNAGLAIANGRYVKFLDADDWLLQGVITQQIKYLESINLPRGFVVSGCPIWVTQERDAQYDADLVDVELNEIPLSKLIQGSPLTSCPLHHRSDLVSVGGFDERVRRGQEHDLHLRLALNGVRFYHHESPVYFYRQHDPANRISGWRGCDVAKSMHEASMRRIDIAKQKLEAPWPDCIREAFAKRLWREGRECLQRGAYEYGSMFFREARKMYRKAPVYGGRMYQILAKVFGPRSAERLSHARADAINLVFRVLKR